MCGPAVGQTPNERLNYVALYTKWTYPWE